MREILFRGFHPCKSGETVIVVEGKEYPGRWVQGFPAGTYNPCTEVEILQVDYINLGDIRNTMLPVIPETVGQFTGLCDKTDKKIFEHDVCETAVYRHGSGGNWYSDKNVNHGYEYHVPCFVEYNKKGWYLQPTEGVYLALKEIEKPIGKEQKAQSASVVYWALTRAKTGQSELVKVIGTIFDKEAANG